MPRKALGKDPFERVGSAKAGTRKLDKASLAGASVAGQHGVTPTPKKAAEKRIKMLKPRSKGISGDVAQKVVEKKIERRIAEFESRLGKLLESGEGTVESAGAPKRAPRNADEDKPSASSEESQSSDSSSESLSSDSGENVSGETDEEGLLRQLIGMASPKKMGKLIGALWLRTHSDDVDEFGKDPLYAERIEPLFEWLYSRYWRVEVEGIENIPDEGSALLVANHSGMLPFDGIMISEAVKAESRKDREVRFLAEDMFSALPFLAPFLSRVGAVRACQENAERLLMQGHLVCVFPEGVKGTGKHFSERYKLQRFGRGGFVKLCMKTKTPLVPVAVIGAEEIYPIMAKFEWIGKPFGLPYVPVTPSWPLLGPLGLVPLPSKWRISFGKPIRFDKYGPTAAKNDILVNKLKEEIRGRIQNSVDELLKKRRSVWFG
jgi:1-acyl-sn-glycerol-3-phosphate acyltransferase